MLRKISLFDLFGIASLIVGTMFFVFFVLILPRVWSGPYYVDATETPDANRPAVLPTLFPTVTLDPRLPTTMREPATSIPTATGPSIPTRSLRGERGTLIVHNSSPSDICAFYHAEPNSNEWSQRLIGSDHPLMPGDSRRFLLPSGRYEVRALFCDGRARHTLLEISGETTWRIDE